MPRQQRTDNARGGIPFRTVATAPGIPWSLFSLSSSFFILDVSAGGTGISLNGVPAFVRSGTAALPTGAALDGTHLTITYAVPIAAGDTFTLSTKDPAFRGAQGQYLQAGVYGVPAAQAPIPVFYLGVGGQAQIHAVNGPEVDGQGSNAPASGVGTDWFVLTNSPTNALDWNITGTISPAVLTPGQSFFYTWDGTGWVGV